MDTEDAGMMPASLLPIYGSDPTYDHDADGELRRIEALKIAVGEFRGCDQQLAVTRTARIGLLRYELDPGSQPQHGLQQL